MVEKSRKSLFSTDFKFALFLTSFEQSKCNQLANNQAGVSLLSTPSYDYSDSIQRRKWPTQCSLKVVPHLRNMATVLVWSF